MAASKRRSGPAPITAGLVWFHRWLGVATCLIFALWFASGAVLLFKPFPSLRHAEKLTFSQPIDMAAIAISPSQAVSAAEINASGLRLVTRAGHPSYLVDDGQHTIVIDARSGRRLPMLQANAVGAYGDAFAYDQWIVHNQYDRYRPFFRIDTNDAGGTQLYVSAVTGETLQRTVWVDRAWNWVGAVLHWAYFTPLRSSFAAWDWTVWSLSFVAMLVAIAGIVLGVMRTIVSMRQRKPSLSYFRLKWLRWHHILGLFAGLFLFSWILSGWLSMDHGRLFSRGQASELEAAAYAGAPYAEALRAISSSALMGHNTAREVSFSVAGGRAIITAYEASGHVTRLDDQGRTLDAKPFRDQIATAVSDAWPGAILLSLAPVASSDFYANAEGWPSSALRITTNKGNPDIYVDGDTGQVLTVMNRSRVAYAWIYYALHTFKFPGLLAHPLLRQILVLIPLSAGFLFSITGVVIGWQRLRKTI